MSYERLPGDRLKGVVRRRGSALDFARKAARVSNEIDEPDLLAVLDRDFHVPPEPFLERVGEFHGAVSDEARQYRAGECLGDRTDPQQRLAIRSKAALRPDLAKPGNRGFAV